MLELGATRVEFGVQTVFDNILYNIERGHTVLDTILATKIAKNSGFKVCYHLMPGLPGTDINKDIEVFKTIFEQSDFKPDMIKIYPTLTIKDTKLYDLWKKGEYVPLSIEKAVKIISKIKSFIPDWIRIQRIQRDIPSPFIEAGVIKSNLRQYVQKHIKEHGEVCRCIRCREIGHKSLIDKIEFNDDAIKIETYYYTASDGEEVFISLVNSQMDLIIGYLRLRDITESHRYEFNKNPCMIIRELKVLGRELPIGDRTAGGWQHRGFGIELLNEAERICLENYDKKHLFVLSGIGVKDYYRKYGFNDEGVYLKKIIK
jgi:elongator complex protein 3